MRILLPRLAKKTMLMINSVLIHVLDSPDEFIASGLFSSPFMYI